MKKRSSIAVGVTSQNGKTTIKYNSSAKGSAIAVKAGAKYGTLKSNNIKLVW